jgi:hypothetical protein
MEADATSKGISKATKSSNKVMDSGESISGTIENKSKKLYNNAIDYVLDYSQTKTPYTANALTAAKIDAELKAILRSVDKSYPDFINQMVEFLDQNYEISLTKSELKTLSLKTSIINEQLVNNTSILKRDIQVLFYGSIGKGMPKKELVQALKDLYPAYSRNAYTITNTGLSRMFVDTNVTKFDKAGFDWYLWAGPNDKLTREIPCKHWVRKKFSASELSTISGVRQGLWNCRHNIIPLSDSMAEDYARGNLNYAK